MFGSSPFGQSSSSPFGSPSVFGQGSNGGTTPFGSQTGGSIFCGTSTGVFGSQSSPLGSSPVFGASSTSAFGSSTPAFGSSVFGQKPAFGGFGSSSTQSSPFGGSSQQSQPAFGGSLFVPFSARVPVILGSKPISFLEELSLTLMPDNNNPRAVTRTRAKNSDHDNLWYKFQPYPKMTEKPEWFWRSIASGFYLKPLLQFGAYGIFDPAYKVCKTLKNFGELTWEPYIRFIACFPQWLWYVYQAAIYFAVRRKELPHYLRFHMINGLLIDVGLEIFVYVNRWFPYSWLWSKVGMHVLTAVGIAYVLTILECIRGALIGMYPHAPFLSQASSIHTHLR